MYHQHSEIVKNNMIRQIGMANVTQFLKVKQSSQASIAQEMLLRKILGTNKSLPYEIFSLIKDYMFRSPIRFSQKIYRLINGTVIYKKPNRWEFQLCKNKQELQQKIQDQQDSDQDWQNYGENNKKKTKQQVKQIIKQSQIGYGPSLKYTIQKDYQIFAGQQYIIEQNEENKKGLVKIVSVWQKLQHVRADRIIQYMGQMLNFLEKCPKNKSQIVADENEKFILSIHVENVLRNKTYRDIQQMEFSVRELAKREIIWLNVNGYNYLCFNSKQFVRGIFKIKYSENRWRFHRDQFGKINIWKLVECLPRTPTLFRYNLFQIFYCKGNEVSLCKTNE